MDLHKHMLRAGPSRMLESKSVINNDKYGELRNKKRREMTKRDRQRRNEEKRDDKSSLSFRVLFEFTGDLETKTFQCIQIDSERFEESDIHFYVAKRVKKESEISNCCSCCNCCCNCHRSDEIISQVDKDHIVKSEELSEKSL